MDYVLDPNLGLVSDELGQPLDYAFLELWVPSLINISFMGHELDTS